MPKREKADSALVARRIANDIKVLRYLLDNISTLTTGPSGSPQKLVVYYAGYTAIRSLWEVKTDKGKLSTGDTVLDAELKRLPGALIFRIDLEISHSIGTATKTLLKVVTFRCWAKKALALWGN